MTVARQIHLVRRPQGVPVPQDVAIVEAPFERAPEGLIGLFEGQNAGKMLIHVAD
jgi:hypothetical protein